MLPKKKKSKRRSRGESGTDTDRIGFACILSHVVDRYRNPLVWCGLIADGEKSTLGRKEEMRNRRCDRRVRVQASIAKARQGKPIISSPPPLPPSFFHASKEKKKEWISRSKDTYRRVCLYFVVALIAVIEF